MIAVRARSTVAIGYLMAQVLVLSPLLAVGGETPDIEKDLTPEEALHYDALDYAAAFDVSVEEAERRLVARYEFEAIRIEAIALAGDRFAGSWLEHSPEFQAVVLLTGNDRLSEVEQVVASPEAGGEVAVRYGARHSYRQLLGGLARLDPLVSDFPGASAGIDMSENTVAFGTSAVLDVATEDLLSTSAGVSVRFDRHPESNCSTPGVGARSRRQAVRPALLPRRPATSRVSCLPLTATTRTTGTTRTPTSTTR